jgi:hypothetical protein
LTTGMFREKLCEIVHLAMENDPKII